MQEIADPIAGIRERLLMQQKDSLDTYNYEKIEFSVKEGVFPPTHFLSTTVFTKNLDYPVGGAFWEVGCGIGVTSVVAAMKGCKRVLASDISYDAVENTLINVDRHNVGDVVSVRQGDLFDVIQPGEKFDVIYWNSNFIYVPEHFEFETDYHKAFADPGYLAHKKFLKNVTAYLTDYGRVYLGFSGQGDHKQLMELLTDNNFTYKITSAEVPNAQTGIQYEILELIKLG